MTKEINLMALYKRMDEIHELMKWFAESVAGKVLMDYRGKVENVGKQSDVEEPGSTAKTVVDEIVQELFLAELHKAAPDVEINVEEDTPLRYLFRGNDNLITVHQDPCDGTLSYVSGSDRFTTGYGISGPGNNFEHTIIFAPARGKLYTGSRTLNREIPQGRSPNIIYNKRLLSKRGIEEAQKAHFKVEEVHCSHLCIVDVALHEAGAFLYGGSNVHDSMIPFAFAREHGAWLVDINGKQIFGCDLRINTQDGFVKFERIPSAIYFSRPYIEDKRSATILDILSDKRNLDEKYLRDYSCFERKDRK